MKKHLPVFCCLVLLANRVAATDEQSSWLLAKNENGIKIWFRSVPNSTLSEFRATTILNTTPEKMVAFLKDVSQFNKWMYKIEPNSARILKKNSDNDYYYSYIMSVPFFKSRESVNRMIVYPPDVKGAITISLSAAPNILSPNDNYVRIQTMKGYYKIVPISNDKIEFTYQAFGSPGGGIPDAIVILGISESPFYALSKLKSIFH